MTAPERDALLVLEDGTAFRGVGLGAPGTTTGEAVFTTGMLGYEEVLTDPSYGGQIVAMTVPHVGTYGMNGVDAESDRVAVAGFVVRAASRAHSNHRATHGLDQALRAAGVVGVSEIDTRRLTRHLRTQGALRGAISTDVLDVDALADTARAAPQMTGRDLATGAGTRVAYRVGDPADARHRVVAYDFGLKRSILTLLVAQGCAVDVVPADTPVEAVLADPPDGVFVSNGPGDPAACTTGVEAVRALLAAEVPTFGICLGHQLLGLAAGGCTYKLAFGHHGTNQPVRNDARRSVEITSQNHGFAVAADSLADGPFGRTVATHHNLNDQTNEGLRLADAPAFSVQYHPEAAPGPHDARYLFALFSELMGSVRSGARRRVAT